MSQLHVSDLFGNIKHLDWVTQTLLKFKSQLKLN